MDWQRIGILGAIAVISVILINKWGDFQERNRPPVSQITTVSQAPILPSSQGVNDEQSTPLISNNPGSDIPTPATVSSTTPVVAGSESSVSARLIHVETDALSVLIDRLGGDIVKVALPQYLDSLEEGSGPLILLNRTESTLYVAQSGLIGKNATDTAKGRPLFNTSKSDYILNEREDSLQVDLNIEQNGVQITKRYTFKRGDNLIDLQYLINNQSSQPWQAGIFGQIKRDSHNPIVTSGMGMKPYLGAAITTTEDNYKKLSFSDLADEDLVRKGGFKSSIQGGWVAMVQHYFLSAWVPDQKTENNYHLRKSGDDTYLLGYTGPQTTVAAGEQGVIKASFYAGPKDIDRLENISAYLDLTVDYGWLWWIAKPLFHFLNFIYGVLGSWGWSIIVLTLMIKLAFFHLSATSYKSMAKMRKFGPEMARMKELYGDDRQKMSGEMMKLYKKEKINPLSGCLPVLVQMPVFISLYWVLMESVQLRHTPFLGWIADLSVKDPLFILPVVMGITMWIQQKLNPTPPDPTQARVMQMLPLVFTFMFMWFPAGLVLYWVVNNSLSIAQQYVITRKIEAGDSK